MKKAFLLGAIAAAAFSAPLFAQPAAPEPDLNRADVETRLTQQLGRVDLDHDGAVTQDELNRVLQTLQSNAGSGQAAERLQAMFTRGARSGRMVIADVIRAQLAAFDSADANHDRVLSAAERQRATTPPRRRGLR